MMGFERLTSIAFVLGIAGAGCGGPQQIAQDTPSGSHSGTVASTPLPNPAALRHQSSASLSLPATSSSGVLYVGANSDIDIFPLTGPNGKQAGSISTDIDGPWGLSVDSNNSLYVANSGNGTVTVYPYGASTPSITYSHGVRRPLYALADSAGHVFVSGQGDGRSGSGHLGRIVEYGTSPDHPIAKRRLGYEADGMAEDKQGNLYVAYRRWQLSGSTIAELGPGLTSKRELGMTIYSPQGLLVDSSGNIIVVESEYDDILVFAPGSTIPSATVYISGIGNLAALAMQNAETTLWVSSEEGYVYSMPYPITSSTVPTEYDSVSKYSNGIAVSNPQ